MEAELQTQNELPVTVAALTSVREYSENMHVELCRRQGRLVIRTYNRDRTNAAEIDLWDLFGALGKYEQRQIDLSPFDGVAISAAMIDAGVGTLNDSGIIDENRPAWASQHVVREVVAAALSAESRLAGA